MLFTFNTKSGIEIILDFPSQEKATTHAHIILDACKCNKCWIYWNTENGIPQTVIVESN